MTQSSAKEMAEQHWEWVESVLRQQLEVTKKMYIDAFVHGYKHGQDDVTKGEK
jgi:hypothetical protein